MFALGIELLMRRAIITSWNNRDLPEWPPHPDRVFMALVAAWGESGENLKEKAALLWLESLGSPALKVSLETSNETSTRTAFTTYVPVNDGCSPISKKGKTETPLGTLPFGRARNGRSFPTIIPDDPTFHLVWPGTELANEHKLALDRLCGQVTYLGHSATPIRIWIEPQQVEPNLVPTSGHARFQFRVFAPGRLEHLEARYNRRGVDEYHRLTQDEEHLQKMTKSLKGKEKKETQTQLNTIQSKLKELFGEASPQTLRPLPGQWQGYSTPDLPVENPVVDGPYEPGLIVLKQDRGRRFSLESCGMIADAIRNTLMSRYGTNPPEWVSGHAPDGSPSRLRRPLSLPLGFVGREHADGHLLGVAIAVPREFNDDQINMLYELLGRHDETNRNDRDLDQDVPFLSLSLRVAVGNLDLVLDETNERNPKINLRPSTWVNPSSRWTTVTPIVLPQFPRRQLCLDQVIAKASIDAGYPELKSVRTGHAPFLEGVPHARSFDPHSRSSKIKPHGGPPLRLWTHAEIEFSQSVRGPVIIGAGRYRGFGFCRPILEKETT
jgi:CRISPR-associated protein Csb2